MSFSLGHATAGTTNPMCEEGRFSVIPKDLKITLRSFEGNLCKIRVIGEMAYRNCGRDKTGKKDPTHGFFKSQCYKKYVEKFHPQDQVPEATKADITSPQDLSDFVAFMKNQKQLSKQDVLLWGLYKRWFPKPNYGQKKFSNSTLKDFPIPEEDSKKSSSQKKGQFQEKAEENFLRDIPLIPHPEAVD